MKSSLVLQSLRTKALELDALYESISRRRDALQEVIQMYEQDVNNADATDDGLTHKDELTNAIEEILTEEQPLHRGTILERVREKGVYVGGKNPVNSLSSYLSIDPRFRAVGRGMWALVKLLNQEGIAAAPDNSKTPMSGNRNGESITEQEDVYFPGMIA